MRREPQILLTAQKYASKENCKKNKKGNLYVKNPERLSVHSMLQGNRANMPYSEWKKKHREEDLMKRVGN